MKLYTIIEIPDEDYELSDKWILDCDGDIEYFSKKDNCWKLYYKISINDCPLRPLPKCRYYRGNGKRFLQTCLKEIAGEIE